MEVLPASMRSPMASFRIESAASKAGLWASPWCYPSWPRVTRLQKRRHTEKQAGNVGCISHDLAQSRYQGRGRGL
eukprot:8958434-Alexandrium_andersonii.AAC.1